MNKSNKDLLINQALLQSLFDYDAETGLLCHKRREGNSAKVRAFNIRYAGRPAGCKQNRGYLQVTVRTSEGSKLYLAHRIIYMLVYGYFPDEVDHINRDRRDNRISNLRAANHTQNQANKLAVAAAKSGFRGVWHVRSRDVWRAQCNQNGKTRTLGYFKTKEEAAIAYNEFAVAAYGEFAILNNMMS